MKKSTVISILLILLGFLFEYLYLATDNIFFDVKFFILGVVSILMGAIGLWVYTIIPAFGDNENAKTNTK